MSELGRENAWATDDGEADDIELINDEIDTSTMAAETLGQSSLRLKIRSFLELFAIEKKQPDTDGDQQCWLGQEQQVTELWYSKKYIFIYEQTDTGNRLERE